MNRSKAAGLFVLPLFIAVLTGCISAGGDRFDEENLQGFDHGARYLVGVLSFEDTTGVPELQERRDSFSGVLISRLQDHQRYRLIEKNRIDSLFEEQSFQMSGMVDSESVQEVGKLLGVEALCITTIERYNYSEEKTSAFIAWIDTQRVELGMSARIVSVATGEILATAETAVTRRRKRRVAFWFLKTGSFAEKDALVDEAMDVALGKLAFQLSEKAPKK